MKLIKRIIQFFTPSRKWRIPVILLLGIFTGLGSYSFYVSQAWTYLSDDPKTCVNCHIMSTEYTTWRHSSHRENATCNDCHVPHDSQIRKYYFKAVDGMRHSAIFTIRGYDQSIRMRDPGNKVVMENCIRCHGHLTEMVGANITYEQTQEGQGKKCWDCHREVPHGRVKSLSSSPYSIVPVPDSPEPTWLRKVKD